MKFCIPHWEKLKTAIKERGLIRLVAKDNADAMARAKRQTEGTATPDDFDPLHNATLSIYSNAVKAAPYLLTGAYCPICEKEKHNVPGDWIALAADGAQQLAKRAGLA